MTRKELLQLVCAQVFLLAAMTGLRMASPLFALSFHYSPGAVGALVALFSLSQIFLALPAGRYADANGIRRPMGVAVVAAVVSLACVTVFPHIAVLCVAAMAMGAASGVTQIVLQRHIGRSASNTTERRQFFSWLAISPAISNFLGPFVAGFLIDHAGNTPSDVLSFRICFGTLAVLPFITWFFISKVREQQPVAPDPDAGQTQAWDLLRSPNFRSILLVNWLQSSLWDIHAFLVPILGYERGSSASAIGFVLGAFAIAAALVRLALPVIGARFSEKQVITASFVISVAIFVIYPFAQTVGQMVACSMILGAALGCVQPMIMSLLTQVTPPSRHGEALGIRLMTINASSFVTPMAAGSFGALIGVSAVFWVIAAIVAVGHRPYAVSNWAMTTMGRQGNRGR